MYDEIHLSKADTVIQTVDNVVFRMQPPGPPQPPRKPAGGNGSGWGGFRKLFGLGPKEGPEPVDDYYQPEVSYSS